VRRRNRPDDRKPEAGPPSGAAVAGAGEAIERLGLEPVRKPGAVVGDLEHGGAVVAAGGQAHLAAAVAKRVLDQVAERLLDPQPVELGPKTARRGDDDLATALAGAILESLPHPLQQHAQLDRLAGDREPALVRSRDHQQVLRELREPVDLLGRRPKRRAQLLGGALGPKRQLELGPQRGQRGAKLVARVGDEDPLALQHRLDAVEHRVERLPETVDLVLRPGERQALAAALERDPTRPSAHRLDRGERSRGQQVPESRRDEERQRRPDRKRARDPREGLAAIVRRGAGDHHHLPVGGARRLAQDARLPLDAGNLPPLDHNPLARRAVELLRVERRSGARRERGGHHPPARRKDLREALLTPEQPAGQRLAAIVGLVFLTPCHHGSDVAGARLE
jgi:hypothetical protein